MSLYRLDFLNDDGSTAEAVRQPIIGGDYLARHASTARAHAIETARESNRAILLTRIGNAGITRPTLVIQPDGRCRPPAGMDSPHSDDRVCFCPACRAQRKAQ